MKVFLGTNQLKYGILNVGQSLTLKNFYINGVKSWKVNIPDYLCFTANQANSTVAMSKTGSPASLSLQYSKDGETWTTFTPGSTTITLTYVGDCVYLRGTNPNGISNSSSYYYFNLSGRMEANGNIMSLMDATVNSTTIPCSYCFQHLFQQCTSLTKAPELPATTLADHCYDHMFWNCTSLTKAPELPATTLASYCYYGMFDYCTSLIEAPELPATTLATKCYYVMFDNCTSLTTAPELPAMTLVTNCYEQMFYNCSKLNDITVAFTNWTSSGATNNWVSGVASSGTFHCSGALAQTRGVSNIPTNWTIDATTTTVTIPTLSGTYTFNGSVQNAIINNYDSNIMTQSGTASATNSGTYTVTWALKNTSTYKWSDGTTTNKSATWTIGTKPIAVTITGTGDTNGCYATINGTKYTSANTTTINLGNTTTTATFACMGSSTSQVGSITINGTTVASSSSTTPATYNYTIPTNINSMSVALVQTTKKSGSSTYYYSVNITTS